MLDDVPFSCLFLCQHNRKRVELPTKIETYFVFSLRHTAAISFLQIIYCYYPALCHTRRRRRRPITPTHTMPLSAHHKYVKADRTSLWRLLISCTDLAGHILVWQTTAHWLQSVAEEVYASDFIIFILKYIERIVHFVTTAMCTHSIIVGNELGL